MLIGLYSFIPLIITFLELTSLLEQTVVDKFRVYMTRTWVGTDAGRPIYAPEIWNWYESTSLLGVRTNNAVEAWNLSLQRSLNCKGRPGVSFDGFIMILCKFMYFEICINDLNIQSCVKNSFFSCLVFSIL